MPFREKRMEQGVRLNMPSGSSVYVCKDVPRSSSLTDGREGWKQFRRRYQKISRISDVGDDTRRLTLSHSAL